MRSSSRRRICGSEYQEAGSVSPSRSLLRSVGEVETATPGPYTGRGVGCECRRIAPVTAPLVDVARDGAVCVLTLRREEKLNALSTALERELGDALEGDEVRSSGCVVVTGSGRAFSAGADLAELRDRRPEDVVAYYRETGDVDERVAALPQPTLSAISGSYLDGGLELALATDFRIADGTAVFGFPEVGLEILPSSGGTYRLARALGPARAKELGYGFLSRA
jgi:enoyl-CoA hydratase/carnithine racemase